MAENPRTWTDVEKTIHAALRDAEEQTSMHVVGLSTPRIVADALRRSGLVDE